MDKLTQILLRIIAITLMVIGALSLLTLGFSPAAIGLPLGAVIFWVARTRKTVEQQNRANGKAFVEALRESEAKQARPRAPAPMPMNAGLQRRKAADAEQQRAYDRRSSVAPTRTDDTPYVPYVDTSYLYQGADTTSDCSSSYDSGSSSSYDSSSSSDSGGSCGGSD